MSNWDRVKRALAQPLDPNWDQDAVWRFLFGPPTFGHVLAGVFIASLIATLYVIAA